MRALIYIIPSFSKRLELNKRLSSAERCHGQLNELGMSRATSLKSYTCRGFIGVAQFEVKQTAGYLDAWQ